MMVDCLIIQQPYASLIALGKKRWEFRGYDTKKTGLIGIASSPSSHLHTLNEDLNKVSHGFPKGVVLATAKLTTSFFLTSSDLKSVVTEPIKQNIHGHEILLLDEPLGEPLEDVKGAIAKKNWQSNAWLLDEVKPLEKPIPFERTGQSTWVKVDIPGNEIE